MKLKYFDTEYNCVSVEKRPNHIIIHTGEYADGEEILYHIYGDIDFDSVALEGGTWTEPSDTESADDVLNALLGVSV